MAGVKLDIQLRLVNMYCLSVFIFNTSFVLDNIKEMFDGYSSLTRVLQTNLVCTLKKFIILNRINCLCYHSGNQHSESPW